MAATFVFNFKARFADQVEHGQKRQTIRANRVDGKRPVAGDVASPYTGLRTRGSRLLRRAPVTRCRGVRITFDLGGELVVDGELLTGSDRQAFAKADGFEGWDDMRTWFADQYGHRGSFEGFCVEWAAALKG